MSCGKGKGNLMGHDRKVLGKEVAHALLGKGAHVETKTVFAALDGKLAGRRVECAPHSVYQLLNHMLYWQEWVVKWLDGERPAIPKHASVGWPGDAAPTSRVQWERAGRRFRNGLQALTQRSRRVDLLSKRGGKSPLEMLQIIALHNSYHAGQVVLLRRVLGAWPPAP
jgi:uncharacterized damage-inducible protein DinB